MYKHKITICLFLLTILIACSNNDENMGIEGQVVNLKIEPGSYTFKAGDAIGLFVEKRVNQNTQALIGDNNYKTNMQWVYQENGNWEPANGEDIIYTSTDGMPIDVYAYYPYTPQTDINGIAISTTLPIMTGKALNNTSNDITLTLNNKTSLLKVAVPDMDILSSAEVTLIEVQTGGIIYPEKLGSDDDFVASTTKKNQPLSFEKGCFIAYLPEQTFEENKQLIHIKENNYTTTYTLPEQFQIKKEKENLIITNHPVGNPANLPNTYMLTPGSELFISTQKAYNMWQTNSLLASTSPDLTGEVTAEIIWQEELQEVIESLDVTGTQENAIIYIKTKPGQAGNAVIGVRVGETIRWSWQIWVSDYNPSSKTEGTTYDFNGLTFMDRNLGATVSPSAGGERTFGFFYQWGRKDPFPMRGNFKTIVVTTGIENNLANSILHPDTYITAAASPNDWYAKTANQGLDRWNSEDNSKTAFDPCPNGWRVPAINMNGESPWDGLPLPEDENKWGNGWYFDQIGYYPAGGQITAAASGTYTGSAGFYHTAITGSCMRIDFTSINLSFGGGRAAARSVRCVKE